MSKVQSNQGFTLVELLIVITLIATIMGFAIPTYRDYTLRAGRIDATASMMRLAAAQEKFYLQQGTYASNAQLAAAPPFGLGFTGATSENGYYTLSIVPHPNGLTWGYTATATIDPAEKQKGDSDCASFVIDQDGRRGANGGFSADDIDECWR